MSMAVLFQELHHDHIVRKRICGSDDLDEVGRMRLHLGESFFQLFCAAKIMVREDQMGRTAQTIEVTCLKLRGGFQLDIHKMAAQRGRFYQNVNLGGDGSFEFASVGGAAAGSNNQRFRMKLNKSLELRQAKSRIGQIV